MKIIAFKCPSCGANLSGEKSRGHMFCEYCGTKIIFDDIKYYREDAKTERRSIAREEKLKLQQLKAEEKATLQKMQMEAEQQKREAELKDRKLAILAMIVLFAFMFLLVIWLRVDQSGIMGTHILLSKFVTQTTVL